MQLYLTMSADWDRRPNWRLKKAVDFRSPFVNFDIIADRFTAETCVYVQAPSG